jgi:ArsR family transcriptional regulator, arsenate/arsenite/antimonite-responsive transcriptional repressor
MKMNKQLQRQYEARADIIKALAHPSRLFIVEELQKQDRNVGELTEMIGADASTISKHLGILKNAGIVSDEKKGTAVYYHLQTPCILNFISCVEDVLESRTQDHMKVLSSCKVK